MAMTTLAVRRRTLRRDIWWLEPVATLLGLILFVAYSLVAGTSTTGYFAEPYLSPFVSPCIAANCETLTFGAPLLGAFWPPAFFVVWIPVAFRATCYFLRRSYYRALFWSPPACAVPDARARYGGETRFPFVLQNMHRYTWYLAAALLAVNAYDAILAYRFPTGIGVGLGSVLMTADVVFLGLYVFSCHSCRYLCGGYLDRFKDAPVRYRLWATVNRLNARHGLFFWLSIGCVVLTDLYIRLLAGGAIGDPRFVFGS